MKKCKDCGSKKEKSEFYGIQGECKECTKKRVHSNYQKNFDYYKRYEVLRNKRPERKKARAEYQRSQRKKNPHKYLARAKVKYELNCGRIEKKPCDICGVKKVEAHHPDHRKPLQVIWLCKKHHLEADRKIV